MPPTRHKKETPKKRARNAQLLALDHLFLIITIEAFMFDWDDPPPPLDHTGMPITIVLLRQQNISNPFHYGLVYYDPVVFWLEHRVLLLSENRKEQADELAAEFDVPHCAVLFYALLAALDLRTTDPMAAPHFADNIDMELKDPQAIAQFRAFYHANFPHVPHEFYDHEYEAEVERKRIEELAAKKEKKKLERKKSQRKRAEEAMKRIEEKEEIVVNIQMMGNEMVALEEATKKIEEKEEKKEEVVLEMEDEMVASPVPPLEYPEDFEMNDTVDL